jgi:hypothetical protein
MKTFKQFLAEMPVLSTDWEKDKIYHKDLEFDKNSEKVGELPQTATKYHIYRSQQPTNSHGWTSTKYMAVDPKTNRVHFRVTGSINKQNEFHINVAGSTADHERGMPLHVYKHLINTHSAVYSDYLHTPGSKGLYKHIVNDKSNEVSTYPNDEGDYLPSSERAASVKVTPKNFESLYTDDRHRYSGFVVRKKK